MGCFMGGEGTVKIDWARYNDYSSETWLRWVISGADV